jgi:hypothetical protein
MSKDQTVELRRFSVGFGKHRDHLIIAAANHRDVMSFILTFEMIWKEFLVVGSPPGCEDATAGVYTDLPLPHDAAVSAISPRRENLSITAYGQGDNLSTNAGRCGE